MGDFFGTDGVRGVANDSLTPELAFSLGRAGGYVLHNREDVDIEDARIILARDTRLSGDMLFGALLAGLNSVGVDVIDLGIAPTPAVAHSVRKTSALGGVMISASHNPVADNGIKFFNSRGFKLSDATEVEIEEKLGIYLPRAENSQIGRLKYEENLLEEYLDSLEAAVGGELSDMKVVLDCAYGAAYELGPRLFRRLGVKTVSINDKPRGDLINVRCGSTDLSCVREYVQEEGADLGIALDGDADRCILIDEEGEEIDGDHIMYITASAMMEEGSLRDNRVVTTRYSNLGLREALNELGGELEFAPNGDKYVLELMRDENLNLGGEKSGHIIFFDHNTSGDGLLTALKVMSVMARRKASLSELSAGFEPWPQLLANVEVERKEEWEENDRIQNAITEAEEDMNGGRVFVRASGTEPVIRVMLEDRDRSKLERWRDRLTDIIAEELS